MKSQIIVKPFVDSSGETAIMIEGFSSSQPTLEYSCFKDFVDKLTVAKSGEFEVSIGVNVSEHEELIVERHELPETYRQDGSETLDLKLVSASFKRRVNRLVLRASIVANATEVEEIPVTTGGS